MKKGWETKELSAVSAINYGYTESAASEPIGPRFLRITDIQDDRVDWDSVPYCKIESADLPKYRLAKGDIVFARTGATTGKSFLVDDPPEAVFASYLIRLRLLDKKLLPEFVSLFFQTGGYWKSIKEGSAGSAQGGFNATKLGALSIPVPPLAEQQRIVRVLDKAFTGIATAQANAEKNLQNTRALFESHLQSVFTKKGERWKVNKLGDVLEVQNGYAFDSKGFNSTNGLPLIRIRSLKSGTESETRFDGDYDKRYVVKAGDLLIGMDGEFGCYEWKGKPALLNQRVCRLQGFSGELVPRFLFYGVNDYLKEIEDVTGFTTVKHLSSKQILAIEFPFPSLEEQRGIVNQLDALTTETQRLESLYEKKLAYLDELKKSILQKAFKGELTEA